LGTDGIIGNMIFSKALFVYTINFQLKIKDYLNETIFSLLQRFELE